jgi:hypothetical protein
MHCQNGSLLKKRFEENEKEENTDNQAGIEFDNFYPDVLISRHII